VQSNPKLLGILGPTGSGKTSLAIRLARVVSGEIVNCDSMQMIQGMEIGTAKPTLAQRQGIAHHLFDRIKPDEFYSAGQYMEEARQVCREIGLRHNTPIVVGGTGLYFRALLEGVFQGPGRSNALRDRLQRIALVRGCDHLHRILARVDPKTASRLSCQDQVRVVRALEVFFLSGRPISRWKVRRKRLQGFEIVKLGIVLSREILYDRINRRVREMFRAGLVDEVQRLLDEGLRPDSKGFEAIGYRTVVRFLKDEIDLETAMELMSRDTRRYAKRQMTWFRKEEGIHWIDCPGEEDDAFARAKAIVTAPSSVENSEPRAGRS
jgi:tRNA dimethylallyltransferase